MAKQGIHQNMTINACAGKALLALALFIASLTGCSRTPEYPAYSPHENLLSIATEFQLLAARDPYRDRIPEDITGQSIARATLVRLANYEALHPGRLRPEVLTLKARALEILGDYESARRNYLDAAEFDTELQDDAQRRADTLNLFLIAGAEPRTATTIEDLLSDLRAKASDYRRLSQDIEDPQYKSLALREVEDADIRRAELMVANRWLFPDGEAQAAAALEQLLSSHRESARSLEHALRLARYHKDLALEEVRLHPPERLGFLRDRFTQHFDAASDIFYRVSQADGRPERLIAQHELDALLAIGEQVNSRIR